MNRFSLNVCNKDTARKSLRHSSITCIVNLGKVSIQWTSNDSYVTPFINRVRISGSSCLLRGGFNLTIKNVSKFLGVLPSFGTASKMLLKKECS